MSVYSLKNCKLKFFIFIILLSFVADFSYAQKNSSQKKDVFFVVNKNGTSIQYDTTEYSDDLIWLKPGDTISVIKKYSHWLYVKMFFENSKEIISGYIQENDIVKGSSIKLSNDLLNLSYTTSIDTLNDTSIKLELITEEEFNISKSKSNYSNNVNIELHKKNGVLTLPLVKGQKIYIDSLYLEGGNEYDYEGEIKELNAYVISNICHHCEELNYFLIDKTTGDALGVSTDHLPIYTKDYKCLMSIGNIPADEEDELSNTIKRHVEISLYLKNNLFDVAWYKEYPMWELVDDLPEFWGVEGAYYFVCQPSFTPKSTKKHQFIQFAKLSIETKKY